MVKRWLCLSILILDLAVASLAVRAQPLSDDVKSRVMEMIAAWQNFKAISDQEARIALIEKALTITGRSRSQGAMTCWVRCGDSLATNICGLDHSAARSHRSGLLQPLLRR